MKIFIVDGNSWCGKIHYSASLDVIFISDKVPPQARDELIERVTKSNNHTIWR